LTSAYGSGWVARCSSPPRPNSTTEDVIGGSLLAKADYTGFDEFWEPFTYGVGPAGQHLASLTVEQRARVRDGCREMLPDGPFSLDARAWYASGTVPAVH
jgi:hypothetical protein